MKDELIDLVFNSPSIWDKRHKNHHNRYILIREWKRIAALLGATETQVRACWKNLRQEFSRQLRKTENRSADATPDEHGSQWPYFQKMLFLQDQFAPREASSNLTEVHDEFSVSTAVSDSDDCTQSDDGVSTQDFTSLSPETVIPMSLAATSMGPPASSHRALGPEYAVTKTGYKRRLTPQVEIDKQLLELEKERLALKKNALNHDHNDEDVGFFNSLLPHVKKLTPKDKFLFRMKVQKTLFELVFPEEQSTELESS